MGVQASDVGVVRKGDKPMYGWNLYSAWGASYCMAVGCTNATFMASSRVFLMAVDLALFRDIGLGYLRELQR